MQRTWSAPGGWRRCRQDTVWAWVMPQLRVQGGTGPRTAGVDQASEMTLPSGTTFSQSPQGPVPQPLSMIHRENPRSLRVAWIQEQG